MTRNETGLSSLRGEVFFSLCGIFAELPHINGKESRSMKTEILDTTLRDGAQGEGISFSVDDRLKIMKRLDTFGVTFIEAGNPASNPKELEFFRRAAEIPLKKSKLVAFGSTRRKDSSAEDDAGIRALLSANTEYIAVFGKSWLLHVDCILSATPEENLNMISDTVKYITECGKHVIFDAEHFFDGWKDNPEYALSVLKTAEKAGAETIVLCDTNGGAFPDEITAAVSEAKKHIGTRLGIHAHNDCGCAAANTLAAVRAGAEHVQGTFTGIGERCGNASLSTVIPDLQLKMHYDIVSGESLRHLTKTARFISEVANVKLAASAPYVGSSAFAHKGGMHTDGVAKNPKTFEHIAPDEVGNERNFLLSEVSGRTAVLSKLRLFEPSLDKNAPQTKRIIEKLKALEHEGLKFEAAGASFELMVLRELGRFKPFFEIVNFQVVSSQHGNEAEKANASIKIKVGDRYEITADEGDGPVNAIDRALRKALEVFYPVLRNMRLTDYKVRVISTGESTAANTRVLIESTDGKNSWTTVAASKDIIAASVAALVDSLEYMLLRAMPEKNKTDI